MKYAVEKTVVVVCTLVMAVVLLSSSSMAESIDRAWKPKSDAANRSPGISSSGGFLKSFLPAKGPTGKNVPTAQKKSPPAEKVKAVTENKKPESDKTRKNRTRKSQAATPARKNTNKNTNKEAVWWESIGNPVVFSFRDCSANYARQQISGVSQENQFTASGLITDAMKSSCQAEFKKMASVMIDGLGEEKSNAMLAELAKTTFLPSVNAAMIAEKQNQRARQMARQTAEADKQSKEKRLKMAKSTMFQCFVQKADRLSVAINTRAHTIADSVLAGCQDHSDVFFDLLLENSKARADVKEQQKNIALNETYRMAIIKRILATRKSTHVTKKAAGASQ